MSMKSSIGALLMASALMGDIPMSAQRSKGGIYQKPPLSKSQKKVRAKNKAAKKARKLNRK